MSDTAAVHASALVIDTHADTPQRFLDEGWEFTGELGAGMINLETARRGNLAAEFFAIWVEPTEHKGNFARRALALTDAVQEQVRRHPAELQLCLSPGDIAEARAARKLGVLLGLEGGHAIENSLGMLRNFYRLGVRYMTLTWANTNEWADSSGDTVEGPIHNGLTDFGRDVIREMNRLGMMVDVSHVSDKTFWDVLEVSSAPVIASHSSARTVTPSHRNLTDEQLRALAERGGVALVNFYPAFIDEAWASAWKALKADRNAAYEVAARPYQDAGQPVPDHVSGGVDRAFAGRIPRPPFASLMAHFEHMIEVAGVDHVGVGTDFDGIPALPEGIDSAADLPRITEALMARGHSAEDVHKVLGGNLMRVFAEIEKKAG
jgi:membrane dipeptidase